MLFLAQLQIISSCLLVNCLFFELSQFFFGFLILFIANFMFVVAGNCLVNKKQKKSASLLYFLPVL